MKNLAGGTVRCAALRVCYFSLSVNYYYDVYDLITNFKDMNSGEMNFFRCIYEVCSKLEITRKGTLDSFKGHEMRDTAITNRFETGIEAESIAMITRHRKQQSLKAYESTRGTLWKHLRMAEFRIRARTDSRASRENKHCLETCEQHVKRTKIGNVGEKNLEVIRNRHLGYITAFLKDRTI